LGLKDRVYQITPEIEHFSLFSQNMPKTRKQKSSKDNKTPEKTPKPSKPLAVPNSAVNHVTKIKIKGFVHPDDADSIPASDDEVVIVPAPEVVIDVSGYTYTLQKCCMLGEVAIWEDTEFHKLNEFSYRQFDTMAIRKLDRAVLDSKTNFEWVSGQVTLCAKNIAVKNQLKINVEDDICWKKVEQGIERWMKEKKTEIVVKLLVQYRKVSKDNDESSDGEGPPSKKVFNIKGLF
jgi:hypothetical protein